MVKQRFLIVASLMMATMSVKALSTDGDGYYLIGSVQDWADFAELVKTNNAANARMTADIDLGECQAMLGDCEHEDNPTYSYQGIFDGQGHTLTVHYTGTSQTAPFAMLQEATVKNIHVAGTINNTSGSQPSIIARVIRGTTTVEGVWSSVVTTDTRTGWDEAAAFVGCVDGYKSGHVVMRDCLFTGEVNSSGSYNGCFVGYINSGGSATVSSCLSLGTFNYTGGSYDIARGTYSRCFVKQWPGTIPGHMQCSDDQLSNGHTAFYLQNGRTDMFWGQKIGVDPLPVLTSDESKRVYRSATGYTNDPTKAIDDQELVPLTYTRNDDNELTITGFDPGFIPPYNYALVIPDNIDGDPVVAIANSAFYQKSNFTSLYIGKNVKSIGEGAFREATDMTTLTFAAGGQLTTINTNAFRKCTALTAVVIPKTVTTMGTSIFEDCTSLTSAAYENGFTMTTIPDWTFYNTRFASFTIPASVTTINKGVFENNSSLAAIEFPATVTKLGEEAFRNCSSLTEVTIPSTIMSMDRNVFWNSGVVTANVACQTLGQGAFYQCASLETVNIMEGVQTLGINDGGAFHGCTKLTTINIPSTVTTMAQNVFRDCTSLTTVIFANGIQLTSIPKEAFYNTALSGIDIPASVTNIGTSAFRRCNKLAEVNIPATTQLTTINDYSFAECAILPSFTMPNTVTTIGAGAFYSCPLLKTVTLSNKLATIPNETFRKCSLLNNVTIPRSVTSLGTNSFRECTSLSSIVIPNSVTAMGTSVFEDCTGLTVASIEDGSTLDNLPDWTFYNTRITSFTIPASVQTINHGVFMKCSALTSIVIPNTVKNFANTEIFRECTSLKKVTFKAPCQLTTIPQNTFYQCTSLEGITIPASVQTIGNSAFRYCEKLNDVTLPGTLSAIQDWAFANCTAMENLTIEEGVTSISRDVFQYSGMKNVVLPTSIGTIGINLFYQCNQLETLDLSKCVNVYELYNYTTLRGSNTIFYGVPASTKIILPPLAPATLGVNDEVAPMVFDLTQDGEDYYLIKNVNDWDKFVAYSRTNPTINGRLASDIDLTGHVGKLGVGTDDSNKNPYKGIFDGQQHVVTLSEKATKDFWGGMFTWVENATIERVVVKGTIETAFLYTGGFVGRVVSGVTMNDCESRVAMTAKTLTSKEMRMGGFIGNDGYDCVDHLTDCLFSGSLLGGTNVKRCAAFTGWSDRSKNTEFTNCLNVGTFDVDPSTTAVLGDGSYIVATNSYYREGDYSSSYRFGTAMSAEQLKSGMVTFRLQGDREEQHWGQLIGTDPAPRLTNEAGTLVYHHPGIYSNSKDTEGLKIDEEGYYLIGTVNDWKMLATIVDDGESDIKARMTADINLGDDQTMIGSGTLNDNDGNGSISFQGIFDGQGHTLIINYIAAGDITAPFRYIKNATIKNLRVKGTITTGYKSAGGVVGYCIGQQIHSYVANCVSSVDIISSYVNNADAFYDSSHHGGVIAGILYYGQLHVDDCIFDGSISGETKGVTWGGMVGFPDGTVTLTNCLQKGIFDCSGVTSGSNGSGTFSTLFRNGYASDVNVNNSFYINQLGNAQGTQATATTLSDGTVTAGLNGNRTGDEAPWIQNGDTPTLKIFPTYIKGDADGDGFVDVNDVTTTINHILGKPVVNFVFEAANIDGDDTIDVNDVQGIIDIALGKNK